MIKIIKEGKKEFTATCPICGCEFSYEFDDLKKGITYNTVKCPCCEDEIVHSGVGKEYAQGVFIPPRSNTNSATSDPVIKDNMVWETPEYRKLQNELEKQVKQPSYVECNKPTNPCETCSYYRKFKSGEIYVGDSPCQWCQYSGLKVTCTSTGTSVNGVK